MFLKRAKYLFGLGMCASLLAGCSTLSAINPFDKSEEDIKIEQGEVAGQEDRISLLSLDDTLQISSEISPENVILPEPYVNPNWEQVGGNLNHVMQHPAASGSLEKLWVQDVGKGSSKKGRVVAPPVIENGYIFIVDGHNMVTALNQSTGKKVWSHKVSVKSKGRTREGKTTIVERITDPLSFTDSGGNDKYSVGGGVAVQDGKLVVTSGLGVVELLDAQTGASLWRKRTASPIHSAPTIANGRIFAVTDDNELMAFDAANGDVLWTYQGIIESARMLTAPSPAVIDNVVIAPFASGEIVALRVQNGGVLWQDALTSSGRLTPLSSLNDIAAGPAVVDGYVVASAQSGVMSAFDFRTGQRVWSLPAGSLGFPWIAGDFVYTVTTDGQVACISKLNGEVVWIQQLRAFKNEKSRKKRIAWSGPVLAGGRLVTVSSRGQMVEINPYNGAIMKESDIGKGVFVSPVIANETLYLLTDEAKLVALK